MLIPFGVFSAAGAGGGAAAGSYELISTTLISSDTASVTFSSIASSYKHLQIRYTARNNTAGSAVNGLQMQFNSDTGSNYSYHELGANGSTVTSTGNSSQVNIQIGQTNGNTTTSGVFSAGIIDILDYTNTSKYKTARGFAGVTGTTTPKIEIKSGAWLNTSAITSVTLYRSTLSFVAGSRFSLYGIKG